jgi:hypothetical protein
MPGVLYSLMSTSICTQYLLDAYDRDATLRHCTWDVLRDIGKHVVLETVHKRKYEANKER